LRDSAGRPRGVTRGKRGRAGDTRFGGRAWAFAVHGTDWANGCVNSYKHRQFFRAGAFSEHRLLLTTLTARLTRLAFISWDRWAGVLLPFRGRPSDAVFMPKTWRLSLYLWALATAGSPSTSFPPYRTATSLVLCSHIYLFPAPHVRGVGRHATPNLLRCACAFLRAGPLSPSCSFPLERKDVADARQDVAARRALPAWCSLPCLLF